MKFYGVYYKHRNKWTGPYLNMGFTEEKETKVIVEKCKAKTRKPTKVVSHTVRTINV